MGCELPRYVQIQFQVSATNQSSGDPRRMILYHPDGRATETNIMSDTAPSN